MTAFQFLLTLCTFAIASAFNLLRNSGFEEHQFTPWRLGNVGLMFREYEPENVHSGYHSLKMMTRDIVNTRNSAAQVHQTVQTTAPETGTYAFSIWAKQLANSSLPLGIRVGLTTFNQVGSRFLEVRKEITELVALTQNWQMYSVLIPATRGETFLAIVEMGTYAGKVGMAFIDTTSLEQVLIEPKRPRLLSPIPIQSKTFNFLDIKEETSADLRAEKDEV